MVRRSTLLTMKPRHHHHHQPKQSNLKDILLLLSSARTDWTLKSASPVQFVVVQAARRLITPREVPPKQQFNWHLNRAGYPG